MKFKNSSNKNGGGGGEMESELGEMEEKGHQRMTEGGQQHESQPEKRRRRGGRGSGMEKGKGLREGHVE